LIVAALVAWRGMAHAADCAAAATNEVQTSICGSYPGDAIAVDLSAVRGDSSTVTCKGTTAAATNRIAVFQQLPPAERKIPAEKPGYKLDAKTARWSAVVDSGRDCPNLVYALYAPVTAPGDPNSPKDALEETRKALFSTLSKASAPTDAPRILKEYRERIAERNGLVAQLPGTSTGAEAVAAEALQILGQLVVDRATAQAFQVIKKRLLELLQCKDDYTSDRGFNKTCRVLMPLRIEDIAMSRDALIGALVSDVITHVEGTLKDNQKLKTAVSASLGAVVATAVVPLVAEPKSVLDDTVARKVLNAVVTYASSDLANKTEALTPAEKAMAVGVLAYVQCLNPPSLPDQGADPAKLLAACDVGANVVKLAAAETAIIPAAQALAQNLVIIATPTPKGTDVRPRLIVAVDTVFDSSCMVLRDIDAKATPTFLCDDPSTQIKSWQDIFAVARPIIDDAVARDTNALIAATVHALQVSDGTLVAADTNRVFVLIGGLLDYTATYTTPQTDGTSDSLHDQRTKILASLTTAMTNRTGRVGDTIASFSGALRLMGGGRISLADSNNHVFLGPLSLPLGFSVTTLGKPKNGCGGCGFHLQVDPVDLGQYLSYDGKATVAKPELEDALSPSLTLGVAWGTSMPFVIGLTVGYSPHFEIDPATPTHKGTFNAGLSVGINVPLLDVN